MRTITVVLRFAFLLAWSFTVVGPYDPTRLTPGGDPPFVLIQATPAWIGGFDTPEACEFERHVFTQLSIATIPCRSGATSGAPPASPTWPFPGWRP